MDTVEDWCKILGSFSLAPSQPVKNLEPGLERLSPKEIVETKHESPILCMNLLIKLIVDIQDARGCNQLVKNVKNNRVEMIVNWLRNEIVAKIKASITHCRL